MLRVVMLILALLAAPPVMAQSDEAANTLFVQAMREIQSAPPIPYGSFLLCRGETEELPLGYVAALVSARAKLKHLMDKYPGSHLAVLLATGQNVGGFNLENLADDIAAAKTCIASPAEIKRAVEGSKAELTKTKARKEVEGDAIRARVERHWIKDPGAKDFERFDVIIEVWLNPRSGVVERTAIKPAYGHFQNDSERAFAESARRAVLLAQPLPITPAQSDLGGYMSITFRGARGGSVTVWQE